MLTVTLSSKGQIVLPQDIRRTLGLQQGDRLEVSLKDQTVLLIPLPAQQATGWQRWRGELAGTDALAEHLAEHAAEVERERLS
jgi:AbrB family looped-hinge helix DNA binding protein